MSDERPGPHWCFLLCFVKAADFYESLLVVLLDALMLWCFVSKIIAPSALHLYA